MAARRDTGAKESLGWNELATRVPALLEQVQVGWQYSPGPIVASLTKFRLQPDLASGCSGKGHAASALWELDESICPAGAGPGRLAQ